MSNFLRGDYVRPIYASPRLARNSVWVVRATDGFQGGSITLDPVDGNVSANIAPSAYRSKYWRAAMFEKVVRYQGEWVPVRHLPPDALRISGTTTVRISGKLPAFAELPGLSDHDAILREILEAPMVAAITTAVANGAGTVRSTVPVDPVTAAVSIADSRVAFAAEALDQAKEQARKQRELAAQKAKEKAKAEREAKAQAEIKAKRDALLVKLQADERLADATKALILEVQSLVKYATPERIAPQEVFQHADQLDALAKSYGYKIVRAGSKCIVAKA